MGLLTTLRALIGTAGPIGTDASLAAMIPSTDGVAEAGKVLVPTTGNVVDSLDITSPKVGGTAVSATGAEINRATDVSGRIVVITATGAITEVLHEGKTCLLQEAGGNAEVILTLPAATGGGGRYRFVVNEVNTSNYVFKSVAGADVMRGCIIGNDGGGVTTTLRWQSGTTDDTLTLNGTTQGGVTRGDWVEFEDIAADGWAVRGVVNQSGAEATPFSDSVA